MYQTSGQFSILLPKGRWRLAVSRGMEYVPVAEEFSTEGEGELTHTVTLNRWINLAAKGWFSGDIHVHHPTLEEAHRQFLMEYARAEDVRLLNILEQTHKTPAGIRSHSKQAGFGKEFQKRDGDYWIVSGQEAPSSDFGHIIGLNIDRLVSEPSSYDFYDIAFRQIHDKKEALVGYAHFSWNGCNLPRGFSWYITTGEVDFVEMLQFSQLNALDYYEYLNLGFRLTAAAGSDLPWGSTIGEVRTYVYTGAEMNPDRWFDGLKKGRSFVTNGPALELEVNGSLPGSEIKVASGTNVKVNAKVVSHPAIGLPDQLQVVGSDGVLRVASREEDERVLSLDFDLPVRESGWLAASTKCDTGAIAHTSPVYLIADRNETWSRRHGPALIAKQLETIQRIESDFIGKSDPRSLGILERLNRAKRFYRELEGRMGGRDEAGVDEEK